MEEDSLMRLRLIMIMMKLAARMNMYAKIQKW